MSSKKSNAKPLSSIKEQRLKAMRQKEETISTVLTTAKDNPKFVKLLIYTLNSLEGFVSPPNREIRINASIIIRLEGVGILHTISLKNINNDEIVLKAGDIIWKLISIYDTIDQELAKLFADKDGHKAVIEILVAKKEGESTIPYIRILNGLVQIPQLVQKLLDDGLADTVKKTDEMFPDDLEMINLNFDTLKKISNQKSGRDFIITKRLVESIIQNINKCTEKKNANAVLCGLAVLDNLCRNDSGKEAIKSAGGLDCLSNVLDHFESDDYILKMCSKIYSKIATTDDMKKQLDLLKQHYEDIKTKGIDSVKYGDVNKCLVLVSNFMLVDEIGKMLLEKDNFELMENLFMEISKIPLNGKDKDFINVYLLMNKYFMIIFYRLFEMKPEIYDKKTEFGKEKEPLIKEIENSVRKNFENVKTLIAADEKSDALNIFDSYFCSYNEILEQRYQSIEDYSEVDKDYVDILLYIINNIIVNGDKYFGKEETPNFIASRLLKNASILSNHPDKIPQANDLIKAIENAFPYLENLFFNSEHNGTLSNSLEVIYDLLSREESFKKKYIENLIPKICDFMVKKKEFRYPCLISMKLLDMYLTPDYVTNYIKNNDPNKYPTHSINYVNCIVNVMSEQINLKDNSKNVQIENEINDLGSVLLKRLIDALEFKNILKKFRDNSDKFDPHIATKDNQKNLEDSLRTIYSVLNIKEYYDLSAEEILTSLGELIEREVKFIEFYKRDKQNQKNPNYKDVIDSSSQRLAFELALCQKINELSISKERYSLSSKSFDILLMFLSKSSDTENIKRVLKTFNNDSKFIIECENRILLESKENISEKVVNVNIALLRKLIENDEIIGDIIKTLINYGEQKSSLCNIMVKGGIPRLLLQIMETTPNVENAELALELLKIITLSNKENLNMVANQNVLLKFFELRAKYSGNQKISENCDLIANEILKLPGQEQYAEEILKEAIGEFNENSKGDYKKDDTKNKLVNNLEVINTFSAGQKQVETLLKGDFPKNFESVLDKTLNDNEVNNINEKLLNNELEILQKMNSNENFDHNMVVSKLMNIIKTKNNYRDLLLESSQTFSNYLKDEEMYNKYIADKVDNEFIDTIFDISENYLDDEKVSKELNNILCYLCLRNEKFADYIKQKGGLVNVLEELKSNVNSNDKNSQQLKLNALKMLDSLCKDENGMNLFIKANGLDLINNIIKNELELYKDYKEDENDLYKTRETLDYIEKKKQDEEEENDFNDSYFIHCLRIIKNALDKGHKEFADEKQLKNILKISNAKYPDENLFKELTEIYLRDDINLPKEEKDLSNILKSSLSLKGKHRKDKEFNDTVDNLLNNKLLDKLNEKETYIPNVKNSMKENPNDNLQTTYLGQYVSQNENYEKSYLSMIDDLSKYTNEMTRKYSDKTKGKDDIDKGVIISLLQLNDYILKHKKEKALPANEIVQSFIFLGSNFYNGSGQKEFSVEFHKKFDSILEKLGKFDDNHNLTPYYLVYLSLINQKSRDILTNQHKALQDIHDYNNIKKVQDNLVDFALNDLNDFCENIDGEKIKITNPKELINLDIDVANDLSRIENISPENYNNKMNNLFRNIKAIIDHSDNKELLDNNENLYHKIFESIDLAKEKGYKGENGILEGLIHSISNKVENDAEVFEKTIKMISEDFKQDPPKEVDKNLSTLANLSKYSTAVKYILNDKELSNKLKDMYSKDDLPIEQRRDLSTIYSNICKNTYYVDNLISNEPETLKIIAKKVTLPNNIIKDEKNIDIPVNEVGTIADIVGDANNYKQVTSKNLISQQDLVKAIDNYKDVHPAISDKLKSIQKVVDSSKSNKKEEENYKIDAAILQNLKKRIESAFDEHINEVDKLNPNFNNDIKEEGKEGTQRDLNIIRKMTQAPKKNVVENTSSIKKRRLSIVSRHLFYDPNNNEISSPISIKNKNDLATALDSLLALIRLLYNTNKTTEDNSIKKQRQHLLLEGLKLLKMLSICPDNHKSILELGLLNFMERLCTEKENDFLIYIAALDILKNCTWSESAVLLLVDSPLLDNLIEEVLSLYEKPDEMIENDELRTCFLYDNINFSNVCKSQKGYEAIFKKIGLDKLISLGLKTGNVDFLSAILEMIISYLNNPDKPLKENQRNDIVTICERSLNLPDKNENLYSKTLKLIGLVYDDKTKEKINNLDLVQKINKEGDVYKDDPEFLNNSIYCLGTVSKDCKKYSDEVIDTKLLEKIIEEVMISEQNNDTVENLSILYKSLVENNEDNRKKMCKEEIFNNIIYFIDKYSKKIQPKKLQTVSSIIVQAPGIQIDEEEKVDELTYDEETIENRILLNLLSTLDLLTLDEGSVEYITKNKFMATVMDTIGKPSTDISIIKLSLHCLGNYFYKDTRDYWKHYEIEQLYEILKTLQKQYYSNSEVLTNINYIAGYILKGFDSKLYTQKYYLLVIDGLNCQDWNENLVKLTLEIMRDSLKQHEDIRNDVFDPSKQSLFNILRLYNNNAEIQGLCYDVLSIFAESHNIAFLIVNSDIMELIRDTLNNNDFNSDPEKRLKIRNSVLHLLNYLAYDEATSKKISYELMGDLLKELDNEEYSEDMDGISKLLGSLCNHYSCVEPFIQFNGLEIIKNVLKRHSEHKQLIMNCFNIIKAVSFSSDENRNKLKEMKYEETIKQTMNNSKPEDKIIKFEGKIVIADINYEKGKRSDKNYIPPNDQELTRDKIVKYILKDLLTKGIKVGVVNPKGKVKDKIMKFSLDLMKVQCNKPLNSDNYNIPPKAKYTLEVPMISKIVKGHGTDVFAKKKGLFSKPPNPELCMSLIGSNEKDGTKSINLVLNKEQECDKLLTYCQLVTDYVKRNVGIKSDFKFDDINWIFEGNNEEKGSLPLLMSQLTVVNK